MSKRKIMVVSFLAFCLTATLLVGVTSSAPYDHWCDVNDDGIIDIVDIVSLAIRFGEEGTPINKTALLLGLQERVEALETGYIGAPAYDSGWLSVNQGQVITLTHNLNTTEVLVYVIGNSSLASYGVNQAFYGVDRYDVDISYYRGIQWRKLSNTTIEIARFSHDMGYHKVRVMIWKIQPTP